MEPLLPFSQLAKSLKMGLYEHYKGKRYRVLSVARHSETLEEVVVYQALYEMQDIWIRPLQLFFEMVAVENKIVPRFRYLESTELTAKPE